MLDAVRTREAASADLSEARQLIQQVGKSAMAERLTAITDEAEGQISFRQSPSVLRACSRAPSTTSSLGARNRCRTCGCWWRARRSRSVATARPRPNWSGIREMESMRVLQADGMSQVSFFERGASLFDDMVALQLDKRHDPQRALSFVERGRARQLADALQPPDCVGSRLQILCPRCRRSSQMKCSASSRMALLSSTARRSRIASSPGSSRGGLPILRSASQPGGAPAPRCGLPGSAGDAGPGRGRA